MNLAIFILLLTPLPVIYYYYTMYQVNERTRYIIGQLAGLWGVIGILLANAGAIRFSYYIIYILLITLVYVFNKIMHYADENFDEDQEEEYEVEWPVEVNNTMMAIGVFLLVILLYIPFFLTPVSPAKINDPSGFDEEEENMKHLPNAYLYEYKSVATNSYVVVITIRSIPLDQGHYENALSEAKPYIEDYIKEEYDQDATLKLDEEGETEVADHDAVEQIYDVEWNTVLGQKSATMVLQAFFCHEDFETIVIGYVYPPTGRVSTLELVRDVEC